MSEPYSRLPLRGIVVFEAAARHGKFGVAAGELQMTQAGVSQHIAQLEAELGLPLFLRTRRGVVLTPAGEKLLEVAQNSLRRMAEGYGQVQRMAGRRAIYLLTDYGFATWWLLPRIAALSEMIPDVEIRLVTQQSCDEVTHGEFDLAVLFGNGDWPGFRARMLFAEEVFPVCAPSYMGAGTAPVSSADLAEMRLLHLRGAGKQRWFGWDDWFAAGGIHRPARRQELTFNNYQIVLQAVLLGQGVGLGWSPLVDELVADGALVRLSDAALHSQRGYHLIEPTKGPANPLVEQVVNWLLAAAPLVAGRLPDTLAQAAE